MEQAWVELDPATKLPVRILRTVKDTRDPDKLFSTMDYSAAVWFIRHQLYRRSKGLCEFCSAVVLEDTAHMHEKQHRGHGGEISLENSVIICPTCHHQQHANREPKFSRRKA
jgi:hypothetical protein